MKADIPHRILNRNLQIMPRTGDKAGVTDTPKTVGRTDTGFSAAFVPFGTVLAVQNGKAGELHDTKFTQKQIEEIFGNI